ncbi:hypothetical protein GGI24_000484 [Coemansia furcata]|nr:hypothetical protein GGI24_000484 [Coemansia furcata]
MAVLSAFQTLPMLIVEKVVEYVDRRNRNVLDSDIALDIDEYNNTKASHQLLWVSERWRVAALSIICDNCEIDFEHSRKGYSVKYPALPLEFSAQQYDMKKSVKQAVVFAPSWSDIGSRKFGIASFQSESELPVFPSASTLMVCLDEDDANPAKARYRTPPATNSVSMDRNQETINFVSSIRRLTPAATGVVVFFRSPSPTVKKNRGQCNTLVLQLCRGNITRLHVESLTECSLSTLKLHSMSELTTITQGVGVACPPFAQLAYRNASTLKVLNLRNVDESD